MSKAKKPIQSTLNKILSDLDQWKEAGATADELELVIKHCDELIDDEEPDTCDDCGEELDGRGNCSYCSNNWLAESGDE